MTLIYTHTHTRKQGRVAQCTCDLWCEMNIPQKRCRIIGFLTTCMLFLLTFYNLYFAVEHLICVGIGFMFSLLLGLSLTAISHCGALKCRITAQHQGSLN